MRRVVDASHREQAQVEELFAARPDLDAYFAEIERLRREVEEDGAELTLAVLPYRFQLGPEAPPASVQSEISAWCAVESLRCLDLRSALAPLGPTAFVDENHLSREGSAAVAAALRALLPRRSMAEALGDALADAPVPASESILLNVRTIDRVLTGSPEAQLVTFEKLGRTERQAQVLGHEMAHAAWTLRDAENTRLVVEVQRRSLEWRSLRQSDLQRCRPAASPSNRRLWCSVNGDRAPTDPSPSDAAGRSHRPGCDGRRFPPRPTGDRAGGANAHRARGPSSGTVRHDRFRPPDAVVVT